MKAKSVPEGYHTLTPYLTVDNAAEAIRFYKKAFGAEEVMKLRAPDGKLGHVEMKIGDSPFMIADEYPEMDMVGPRKRGGATSGLVVYVDDADLFFDRAVRAGATVIRGVEDQFYGDRSGQLEDPFGHRWTIGTHKEDVPAEEMQRRFDEWAASQAES